MAGRERRLSSSDAATLGTTSLLVRSQSCFHGYHRSSLTNGVLVAEFYEKGADTTIVQRSSTYVVSSKHGLPAWLNGFYQEGGPHVDDADILFTSLPTELVGEFHKISTAKVAELDKPILDGLEKVGFKLNRYNSGL